MKRKRKPIKWWAVPLLVLGAILATIGVTSLVMYLIGALDEEKVEPENISFSSEVQSGLARYDASGEDSSGSYGTFYASSDFSIVISSSTEGVTADSITLKLNGTTTTSNGYISNGIITVPQTVKLNTAFTVQLVTDSDGAVVGGVASIQAQSENSLARYKTVYVAVDVPASSFALEIVDTATDEDGIFEVIEGTTFSVDEIFTPTNAKYLYSDSQVDKEVFYTYYGDDYITLTDNENGVFTADKKSTGTTATITAYTFKTAYAQEAFLEKYSAISDRDTLARLLETEISSNSDILSSTITLRVVDVSVKSVTITDSLTLTVTADKAFTLTANSTNGNGSLGAVITDTTGVVRSSLASNIGILVSGTYTDGTEATFKEYTLSGGLIMKVVTSGETTTITQVTQVSNDGATYYYLPNTTISPQTEYGNYYWTFATTSDLDLSQLDSLSISLKVNYFYQDDTGAWNMLYDENKLSASMQITTVTETPAAWTTSSELELEITYDSETGNEIAASVLLSDLLATDTGFENNTYQTVKYFFLLTSDATTAVDEKNAIASIFNVANSYEVYTTDIYGNDVSYYLLEISDDYLIASVTSSDTFNIVAVTVRTDANGKIVADTENDTKYQIVNVSGSKKIVITSALSIANMTSSYVALNNSTTKYQDGNYYVPYAIYDTDGKLIEQISFVLNLVKKSQTDKENLTNAITDGTLTLQVLNEMETEVSDLIVSSWSTIEETTDEDGNDILQCTATVTINEETFANASTRATKGTQYKFQLSYNNGTTTETKDLTVFRLKAEANEDGTYGVITDEDENEEDDNIQSLYVYYPEPTTISTGYSSYDTSKTISVAVKSGGTTITWEGAGQITTISALNELFTFDLVDQFGNYIISEGVNGNASSSSNLYSIKFVEDGSSSIIGLNSTGRQIQNFSAADTTTSLTPYIVDNNNSTSLMSANMLLSSGTLTLTFAVESEGLSAVYYTTSTTAGSDDSEFAEATNLGSITIQKYVTKSSKLKLTDLVEIYVGKAVKGVDDKYENYKITFSNKYTATTTEDLSKMMYFNDETNYTFANYFNGTYTSWLTDTGITQITFNSAFGKDTTLYFVITDGSGLFEIEFNVVCLAGGSIGTAFSNYAKETVGTYKYGDFLPTYTENGVTYASVFANSTYELNTYLPITSLGGLNLQWNYDSASTLVNPSSGFSLINGDNTASLVVGDVSTAQRMTFTIYLYNIQSSYTLYTTVTLYVVPNIIVVEEENYYTLGSNTNSVNLSLYKATDYISYLANIIDKPTALTLTDTYAIAFVQYEETDDDGNVTYYHDYLSITNTSGSLSYGDLSANEVALDLGGSLEQIFKIQISGEDVQFVRLTSDGTIVTSDTTNNATLFTVQIGLGTASETIEAIFGSVQIVEYSGLKLLLASEGSATAKSSFSLTSCTGSLYLGGSTILHASQVVSLSSGTVAVEGTFGSFVVTLTIDVLVNATGENLVYYTDAAAFNQFSGATFEEVTGLNLDEAEAIELLEENEVYENVEAGQTIEKFVNVYSSEQETYSAGLYYYSTKTAVPTLTVVDIVGYSAVDGSEVTISVDDLITITSSSSTISITINNLSTDYSCVYVIFKLSVAIEYANTTTYYYRLKIEPNFTAGGVTYPVATSAEYLDSTSGYYSSGTYTVDLTESLTQTSMFAATGATLGSFDSDVTYYTLDSGVFAEVNKLTNTTPVSDITYYYQVATTFSRFTSPTYTKSETTLSATLTGYEVSSITMTLDGTTSTISGSGTYATVSISADGVLTVCPQADYTDATFTIVVVAKYAIDEMYCYGGDLLYTIVVNGGSTYSYSLTGSDGLSQSGNVYALDVAAESSKISLTASISTVLGTGQTTTASVGAMIECDDSTYLKYVNFDGTTLTITSPSSVPENVNLTISFHTSERVVFKLVITFTSFYSYTIGTSFTGGTTYKVYDSETGLFTALSSTSTAISTISLSLLQSVTGLESFVDGYAYYTYNTNTEGFEVTDTTGTPDSDTTYYYYESTTQFGDDVLLTDLCIVSGTSISTATIEFAHLLEDTEFTFVCTINPDDDDSYTFTFTITVEASFSTSASFTYNANGLESNSSGLYGGLTYTYTIDNIATQNTTYSIGNSDSGKTTFTFKETSGSSNTITPEYVSISTTKSFNDEICVSFNGNNLFSFKVKVTYTDLPSVSVTPNYAVMADGTQASAEYLKVSDSGDVYLTTTVDQFFATTAPFAEENRLTLAYTYSSDSLNLSNSALTGNVAIEISSISNAQVIVTDSTTQTLSSAGDSLSSTLADEIANLSFRFDLLDSSIKTGTVVFKITICGVITEYSVILTQNDIVTLQLNSPSSTTSGEETIYAEDLSNYEEMTIFTQDRLISFTAASSGTFTFVFSKGSGTTESRSVTAEAGTATIVDLGKSFTGWTIYSVNGLTDYSSLFTVQPTLTARIVATYANGKQITIKDSELTYTAATESESYTFDSNALTAFNFVTEDDELIDTDTTTTLNITYTSGTFTATKEYALTLTTNISMKEEVIDSSNALTYYDLTAGSDVSLLGDSSSLAAILGIQNNSGTTYTSDMVASNNATLLLQAYGFTDLQVLTTDKTAGDFYSSSANEYQELAYTVHKRITTSSILNADGVSVRYTTGITPRYGMTINTTSGSQTSNYLSFSGNIADGNNTNYTITGQGAQNDGNFVLLRLTYTVSVTIDGVSYPVESVFHILIRVLPNVSATHKINASSSYYDFTTDETYGNEYTVASNMDNPYEIKIANLSTDTYSFSLFTDLSSATDTTAVISTDTTTFTATRTVNDPYGLVTYNNEDSEENEYWAGESGTTWTIGTYSGKTYTSEDDGTSSIENVKIYTSLTFGQQQFKIVLTDAFGYVIEFFFSLISEQNPSLSNSLVLTEGDYLDFYANASVVVPTTATIDNESYYALGSFTHNSVNEYLYLSGSNISGVVLQTTYSGTVYVGKDAAEETTLTNATITAKLSSWSNVDGNAISGVTTWAYNGETIYSSGTNTAFSLGTNSGCVIYVYIYTGGQEASINAFVADDRTGETSGTALNLTYSTKGTTGYSAGSGAHGIQVSGLTSSSYAISTSDLVDTTAAVNAGYYSILQNISVESVEFYYGSTKIGSAKNIDSNSYTGLSLDSNYIYLNKAGDSSAGASSGRQYLVPNVPGIYYDMYGNSGDAIDNVTMYVKLKYSGSTTETTVISTNVTLQRKSFDLFESTTIADGTSPILTGSSYSAIYNDTLEIDLEAGESVTLAVTTTAFEYDSDEYYRYIVTTDTTPDSTKTYYTYGSTYTKVSSLTTFDEDTTYYERTTANFITLTNSNAYSITEYVSISQNLNDELVARLSNLSTDTISILALSTDDNGTVSSPTIRYNGVSKMTATTTSKTGDYYTTDSLTISTFSGNSSTASGALTVEIPSVDALSEDNTMSQTLYFVVSANSTTYQVAQTFTVQTRYTSAAYNSGSAITITEYYSVSNGTNTFYVAPFTKWASVIVTGTDNADGTSSDTLSDLSPTMFTFKISEGSAYIDENGTITTMTNFQESEHKVKVEIFMNVAGRDGNFEEQNEEISLGVFEIWFSDSVSLGTTGVSAVSTTTTEVYTFSKSHTIITIPTGYTLYSTSSTLTSSQFGSYTSGSTYNTNLSVELGGTIDFSEYLSSQASSLTNVAYHIISEDGTAVTGVELNTHTFTSQGTKVVNVLVTGYSGSSYRATMHSVTVIVYDSSSTATSESVSYAISSDDVGSFKPQYTNVGTLSQFVSGVTYYTESDGVYSKVDTTNVTTPDSSETYYIKSTWWPVDSTGQTKAKESWTSSDIGTTYFVETNSTGTTTYKLVTLKLFVYSGIEYASVAITTNGTFTLSSLDANATFYSCENLQSDGSMDDSSIITTDSISSTGTRKYLAVTGSGTSASVVLWEVYFKTSNSVAADATYGEYVQGGYVSVGTLTEFESGVTYYTESDGVYSKVDTTTPTTGTTYYVSGISANNVTAAILSALGLSEYSVISEFKNVVYTYSSAGTGGSTLTAFDGSTTYYTYSNGTYSPVDTTTTEEPVEGVEYFTRQTTYVTVGEEDYEFENGSVLIQQLGDDGVLEFVSDIQTSSALSTGHLFYVTYKINGVTTTTIISMNFYVYSSVINLGTFYAQNSTQWNLSGMNDAIGKEIGTGYSLTYYEISGSSIVATTSVNLQSTTSAKYFVRAEADGNVTYYLLTVSFQAYNLKSITLTSSSETLAAALQRTFGDSAGFELYSAGDSIDPFTESLGDTSSTISTTTTYYVAVTISGTTTYYKVTFKVS